MVSAHSGRTLQDLVTESAEGIRDFNIYGAFITVYEYEKRIGPAARTPLPLALRRQCF